MVGKKSSKRGAFTLIELLIVVAIIAILAAIAVPNFLEAQVRAKVSRIKSDMRTSATALESYAVDNNKYPVELPLSADGYLSTISLSSLTTPIAYITSLAAMIDVFNRQDNTNLRAGFENGQPFLYGNYEFFGQNRNLGPKTFRAWGINSLGPDKRLGRSTAAAPLASGTGLIGPWAENNDPVYFGTPAGGQNTAVDLTDCIYDPTNGTVSPGDIYRVGGSIPGRSQGIMSPR